ncbi:MAG: hypothetical protein MCS20_01950, partial [Candidatus Phytoplasma mali]|nr:hypothetical protein [Candidatus Phytoplasma australiense]MCG7202153.1 hypothetical protein [Candidatus Phytoplasma mali]
PVGLIKFTFRLAGFGPKTSRAILSFGIMCIIYIYIYIYISLYRVLADDSLVCFLVISHAAKVSSSSLCFMS